MKSRRLVWQLYPTYILLILIVLCGLGWYVSVTLRNFHYQQTAADLSARAHLVEEQLQGSFDMTRQDSLNQLVKRLGESSQTRITIIRLDGQVLADSEENPERMENHSHRPEIQTAISGKQGMSIRFSRTLGQTLMYVALPFVRDGEVLGTVRTAISVSDIDRTLTAIYQRLFFVGFLIALLIAPVSW